VGLAFESESDLKSCLNNCDAGCVRQVHHHHVAKDNMGPKSSGIARESNQKKILPNPFLNISGFSVRSVKGRNNHISESYPYFSSFQGSAMSGEQVDSIFNPMIEMQSPAQGSSLKKFKRQFYIGDDVENDSDDDSDRDIRLSLTAGSMLDTDFLVEASQAKKQAKVERRRSTHRSASLSMAEEGILQYSCFLQYVG
jgi:hypothetical protein